jgi:hypothetical protein
VKKEKRKVPGNFLFPPQRGRIRKLGIRAFAISKVALNIQQTKD